MAKTSKEIVLTPRQQALADVVKQATGRADGRYKASRKLGIVPGKIKIPAAAGK